MKREGYYQNDNMDNVIDIKKDLKQALYRNLQRRLERTALQLLGGDYECSDMHVQETDRDVYVQFQIHITKDEKEPA